MVKQWPRATSDALLQNCCLTSFFTSCVCTTDFPFPCGFAFSEFLIVDFTSFFQWVKRILTSVLSLWNSAVLPDLHRQYFINILSLPLPMLVVVKTLNRAGPGQPVWDLPFTCLLWATLSAQNIGIHTYTVQMCSDSVQRWKWNLTW